MPAYARDSAEWKQSVLRVRDGAAWTADDGGGYVYNGGAWVAFQPEPPADLLAPENLAVDAGDLEATLTWTNPTQDPEPTHVQVRIPETTAVWTEVVYPATSFSVSFLTAGTPYQFQARYIIRTDGEITAEGAIAEIFFNTTELTGPGTLAEDPDGTAGDGIVTFGTPTGGTGGAVDSADCWWEYVVQEFDADTYVWSDTATTAEIAGNIGDYEIDFITLGFECAQVLRWKYREVCNSTPATWQYSEAFTVICDFDDPCGGVPQTTSFSSAPWNDADIVFAMPKICYVDDTKKIIDFVAADVEYGRLSAYNVPLYISGAWELRAKDGLNIHGEALVAGRVPGLVPLGSSVPSLTSDFTFSMSLFVDQQPSQSVKIAQISDTVRAYMIPTGTGVKISVIFGKEGGGLFNLASSTELALDTWHTIAVTIDQDGDKILYINGAADVTDDDTTRANFDGITGNVELYANDRMRTRKVGGWDRVLTPDEIAQLNFSIYDIAVMALGPTVFWAATPSLTVSDYPTYAELIDSNAPTVIFFNDPAGPTIVTETPYPEYDAAIAALSPTVYFDTFSFD